MTVAGVVRSSAPGSQPSAPRMMAPWSVSCPLPVVSLGIGYGRGPRYGCGVFRSVVAILVAVVTAWSNDCYQGAYPAPGGVDSFRDRFVRMAGYPFGFDTGEEDMKDQLEELIDAAHDLFGDYSVYEAMDLDRPAAIARMVEMYGGSVDPVKMERYFSILDQIRE